MYARLLQRLRVGELCARPVVERPARPARLVHRRAARARQGAAHGLASPAAQLLSGEGLAGRRTVRRWRGGAGGVAAGRGRAQGSRPRMTRRLPTGHACTRAVKFLRSTPRTASHVPRAPSPPPLVTRRAAAARRGTDGGVGGEAPALPAATALPPVLLAPPLALAVAGLVMVAPAVPAAAAAAAAAAASLPATLAVGASGVSPHCRSSKTAYDV